MHNSSYEKAWFESPWKVLLDITRIERIKVWEIKLTQILQEFTQYMKQLNEIDFNLCGIIILSAATIHRMKTHKLLQEDRPPTPKPQVELFTPQPLQIPFKPETYITTLQDIADALHKALLDNVREKASRAKYVVEESRFDLTEFIVNIEREIENFIEIIKKILSDNPTITFRELVSDKPRVEVAKTFILLLFAAARGVVFLLQEEESSDIVIMRGW